MPETITPFRAHTADSVLDDLRDRLSRTRFPDQLPDAGWDYGTELSFLQALCEHWRDKFDWRAAEARLNAFPQFTTEINGEHLHLYHIRSDEPDALPLIITHGYPGSVAEFLDIFGPLSDPAKHGGDARDAHFPAEIRPTPRLWAEQVYTDIVRWTEMPKGGHFAAFEQPKAFVEELRSFARPFR